MVIYKSFKAYSVQSKTNKQNRRAMKCNVAMKKIVMIEKQCYNQFQTI